MFTIKNCLPFDTLIETLVDQGYERVSMVMSAAEFAVRGGIVDFYPDATQLPIRLEFDGDQLERIARFNSHNQRSQDLISEFDIPKQTPRKAKWLIEDESVSPDLLSMIQCEDPVVHEDYGVGIYKGLVKLTVMRREGEFLWIQYKGEDRIYVPIEQSHLVHPYSGADKSPPINGLYDGSWKRIKSKAEKATTLYAESLFQLYQQRQENKGVACEHSSEMADLFAKGFPYTLTPDQDQAVQDIYADQESANIMDRLLCGDVGYGKTEVLLRAAFKALENGQQVAILVPTTLLAEQHYETFKKRLADFPFRLEVLSRFHTKAEQQHILQGLKRGVLDMVVGTHRLLQKDVAFSHLGLLVIDEEQRFGVSHKERIKQLKSDIDVLCVSATPIPRTLYMALTGARDLSTIQTPPRKRKPVITQVMAYKDSPVKKAIQQELKRDGQVFYLHNKVETIVQEAAKIAGWFPNAKVVVGHGQMKETALQQVMMQFWSGEADILVCTTIIENGIDVPRANTLIMDMAENYGVSQIHQLRGRVGRTQIQGYAYLFYSNNRTLTEKAKKRLQAIQSYTSLGAGYQLALKDLEIRGAGTLLGHKQHGNMMAVGFELYCKLLQKAVKRLKQEPINETTISFSSKIKAYIPDTYVPSDQERLTIYQRMMSFNAGVEIDALVEELEDRYGPLPKLVELLLESIKGQLA